MATPVTVRRLSDEEGRQLQRIVRRGGGRTDGPIVKWLRALVVLASAGGDDVAAIARLVRTSPQRFREMIHTFNKGMRSLEPQPAGAVPAGSRLSSVDASSRRPRSVRPAWASPFPGGVCAIWPASSGCSSTSGT